MMRYRSCGGGADGPATMFLSPPTPGPGLVRVHERHRTGQVRGIAVIGSALAGLAEATTSWCCRPAGCHPGAGYGRPAIVPVLQVQGGSARRGRSLTLWPLP